MSQLERNKKLVLAQHREVGSRSDREPVECYYASEVVLHFAGREVIGRPGIKAVIETRRNAFPDWQKEVQMIIAEGDFVSSRLISTATHAGPFLGLKLQTRETSLFRIQSDVITECWGELDMLGLLNQIRQS